MVKPANYNIQLATLVVEGWNSEKIGMEGSLISKELRNTFKSTSGKSFMPNKDCCGNVPWAFPTLLQ